MVGAVEGSFAISACPESTIRPSGSDGRESPILSQKLTGNPARAIQVKMASDDHRKSKAILPLETSFHGRVAYSSVEVGKDLVDLPILLF